LVKVRILTNSLGTLMTRIVRITLLEGPLRETPKRPVFFLRQGKR